VLNTEAEVHDIAVLHDVFFAFDAQFAGFFGTGFAAEFDVVIEAITSARMKPRSKSV
jgi:hypothetical protein